MNKDDDSLELMLQNWPEEKSIEDAGFSEQLMARIRRRERALDILFYLSLLTCAVMFLVSGKTLIEEFSYLSLELSPLHIVGLLGCGIVALLFWLDNQLAGSEISI